MKRESIDSIVHHAVDGFFFVEAQSAHPVCGRKEGGSAPVAERAARRTGGEEESGEAWNEKMRRCVTKRTGESKRRTGYNLKARGESKNKGCAIEKQGIAESKRRGRNSKECGVRNPKAHGTRNQKACNLPTTL